MYFRSNLRYREDFDNIYNMVSQISRPSKPSTLNPSPKVFVGLSGGVDSSVSAALLQKAGYQVTGVFIKVWQPDWIECTWKEDRLDAKRVCAKLDIPFVELNLEKEYKKEVVDYMISEYRSGKTPNPDVMCNKYIKFGGFYSWAMEHGADYVATGHYARIGYKVEDMGHKQKQKIRHVLNPKPYTLQVGLDSEKDQSYFLWQIRREQLPYILFPVGGMQKSEVRKLAKEFTLITADKKDSQGLCFMGKIDMKEFLKNYIKPKSGKVLDTAGKVIGTHDGASFFTLGERHGFEITQHTTRNMGHRILNTERKPYYVVAKDVKKNTLTVSNDKFESEDSKPKKVFEIKDVNWLGSAPRNGAKLSARIRYRQSIQKAKIIIHNYKYIIQFESVQNGGAPGQSIVIYDGNVCIGGGIIK